MENQMSDQIVIYHNPRCSKSRAALKLLQERGVEPQIIEYLKTPPSAPRLKQLLAMLEMSPRELMRKGEDPYKELGLGDDPFGRPAILDHPLGQSREPGRTAYACQASSPWRR